MQQKAKCNYKYPAPQRQAGLRNVEPASARAQHRWSHVSSFPVAALAARHPLQHSLLEALSPSWAAICPCHPSSSHPSSVYLPAEMNFSRQLELQLRGFMPWSSTTWDGGQPRRQKGNRARQNDKAVAHTEGIGTCTTAIPS